MKKLFVFSLALLLCFSVSLLAQEEGQEMAKEMDEKKMDKKEMDMSEFQPPPPVDNEFLKSMAGTWKGTSENPMGKSEDWMKAEMGLDGQFLMIEVKSKWEGGKYKGMGVMTLNEDGTVAGFWIDNYREMAKGHGKIEGNKLTMNWEGKMGKGTRVTEMGEDKFTVNASWTMPDGTTMKETSKMMRVDEKMMDKEKMKMEKTGKEMMDKAKMEKEKMTDKKQ